VTKIVTKAPPIFIVEAINREFAVPDSGKLLPKGFMFELNQEKFNNLRSQFDTSSRDGTNLIRPNDNMLFLQNYLRLY